MDICLSTTCGIPESTAILAWIGLMFLYSLMAFIVFLLLKEIKFFKKEKDLTLFLAGIFPIAIPSLLLLAIGYIIALWIIFPFIGATKKDLQETEDRLMVEIHPTKNVKKTTNFKVGDLITGVKGNPDGYKYLTEKSVCKVRSIDSNGNMRVILVDHKDPNKSNKLYEEFRAPARNFVLYKKR